MFDINGWEFLLLGVLAILVLGPERLPEYAGKLGRYDPATKRWHFRDRNAAPVREVDVAAGHVLGQVRLDPGDAKTYAMVRGARSKVERLSFDDVETVRPEAR